MNKHQKGFAKDNSIHGFAHIFVLVVVLLVGIFVFGYFRYYKNQKAGEMTLLDATLAVEAPFSTSKVTITENSEVFYVAEDRSNNELGTQSTKNISKSEFDKLSSLVMSGNFFNLENKPFIDTNPLDLSTYVLTMRTIPSDPKLRPLADPGVYTVSCYEENCEPEFLEIKNIILEIWGEDVLEIGI